MNSNHDALALGGSHQVSCILFICLVLVATHSTAFIPVSSGQSHHHHHHRHYDPPLPFTAPRRLHRRATSVSVYAKSTKKKKTKQKSSVAGIKGFGASSTIQSDRSKATRDFYEQFLEVGGAGENLKRTSLGLEPDVDFSLRGVLCTRDIPKGSDIINIPSSLSVNLGEEGGDPTLPAVSFLQDYCTVMRQGPAANGGNPQYHYFAMLPGYQSTDCLGSTDFFSDAALDALQSPLVVEETLERREQTRARFEADIANRRWLWIDGETPVTSDHLQWAVWLITSRVLTVQTEDGNPPCRLLIPYLDMCNHHRSSPHVLTGRVGGPLKVKAGAPVKAGSPIHIAYGGGVAGNNRFLQDYGFLDADGYTIVAQELLGKRRMAAEGAAGQLVSVADQKRSLDALRATSTAEDAALLDAEQDPAMRTAIEYRMGVKKALSKFTGIVI